MDYISESICKISKQRQDNYNDYYFYPQKDENFKKEAFEDKIVIVKVFNADKQLIDEFNINVNTFWKSDISTQIRTTTRNGQDVSKKYSNSKIISFPKRYLNKFNIDNFYIGEDQFTNNQIYSPGLTIEDWKKLFQDKEVLSHNGVKVLELMYRNGGEASCKQLSILDGNTNDANYYKGQGQSLAMLVFNKTNCKKPELENGSIEWYSILFNTRKTRSNEVGSIVWQMRNEIKTAIEELNLFNNKEFNMDVNIPLNQILYGPPGTGKTYNTVLKAMSIIDNVEYKDVSSEQYSELKNRFDELKQAGQIEFVTFHQSYSYEEFVEGIKPNLDSENLSYQLENGIFKQICNKAIKRETTNFDEVYNQFLDEVIEYENENSEPFTLKTSKNKTFGIEVNPNKNLRLLMGKDLKPWGTLTKTNLENIADWKYYAQPIYEYLKKKYNLNTQKADNTRPYILIIDEINRGDVSKIFGELITLIEEDKRIGNKYQMKTTLPYSKEPFGVPNNLYIIGTMNTADRSIALLDTALRRRFDFEEIMPRPELLNGKIVAGINLEQLLKRINERITEKYDKDHQIGHSYLMGVETEKDLERAYKNRILPLLNEYFYNDTKTVSQILNCSENELQNNFLDVLNKAQNS